MDRQAEHALTYFDKPNMQLDCITKEGTSLLSSEAEKVDEIKTERK